MTNTDTHRANRPTHDQIEMIKKVYAKLKPIFRTRRQTASQIATLYAKNISIVKRDVDANIEVEESCGMAYNFAHRLITFIKNQHSPERPLVLDVGAGICRYSEIFLDADMRYVALDCAHKHLVYGQKNYSKDTPFPAVVGSYHGLPFADSSVDAVWCGYSFGYCPISAANDVIRELARITKKNGIVMIVNPSIECTFEHIVSDGTHAGCRYTYWKTSDLTDIITHCGLKIIFEYEDVIGTSSVIAFEV